MYQIRSESAKTFLEDRAILLPRFQRPLKWEHDQLFHFALSVFKQYPLGVVVVKADKDRKGKPVKYLLDGRQRRHALKGMRNPEQVYHWAQKSIRFKARDDPHAVADAFWRYVQEYFGQEGNLEHDQEIPAPPQDDEAESEEAEQVPVSSPVAPAANAIEQPGRDAQGLVQLLQLILLVHPMKRSYSGLTKPFLELGKLIPALSYMGKDAETARPLVNTEKLLNWLDSQRKDLLADNITYPPDKGAFIQYVLANNPDPHLKQRVTQVVEAYWQQLENMYDLLEVIEGRFNAVQVGYLELSGSNANDDKKIFEIINSAGTPLTAIEILSAKPSWNTPVVEPDPILVENKDAMYKEEIGIPLQGLVRWDVPATLAKRLSLPRFFAPAPKTFEQESTLGFKLFAGAYRAGVTKIDISDMGNDNSIPWGTRQLDTALNDTAAQLAKNNIFRYAETWPTSLYGLTSIAVYMNYMLVMMKDWQRKQEPRAPGSRQYEQFQRNGVILFDRMIYEYVTAKWRGSSDSKIAASLEALEVAPDTFEPVNPEAWQLLADELVQGTIGGDSYLSRVDSRVKCLLYYSAFIQRLSGPKSLEPEVAIDHIIPESRLLASHDPEISRLANHVCNLALLPHDVNIQKSNRALLEIRDNWTIDQIAIYEGIKREDFQRFSKPEDISALIAARSGLVRRTLTTDRELMISTLFRV